MERIVTITFSPCIDKSTSVAQLIPEKKLKCSLPILEPGGGGINVARAIKKLGGIATAIYPAGGYTGKYFIELLAKEQVPSIIVETKGETRENIIVLDELSDLQYRFGMPGNPLLPGEWQMLLHELEKLTDVGYIVASGSLPPGVPPTVFANIAAIAKKKNAKFIADTSGDALKCAAEGGAFLLKPNLGELSYLVGKEYLQQHEICEMARQVICDNKCEILVVSMGCEGALLITKNLEKKIITPPVKRKSTVGAGDSMVAGIVLALSRGSDNESAVQYGVACGTAATLSAGTGLCKKEDAEDLFQWIRRNG